MTEREARRVLGVGMAADGDAIRKAYRRLAMKHHPDRNDGGAESGEKFKEIQQAYERLTSTHEASEPDDLEEDFHGVGDPFADLFGAIFGNMRSSAMTTEISLETAVRGGPAIVKGFGGSSVDGGLKLNLPAGTLNGSLYEIRVDGKPHIVRVRVRPPGGWDVDGGVLRKTISLNLLDQLLGAKVEVNLPLVGPMDFEVPPNLQSGAAFNVEHPALRPYRVVVALDFSAEMSLNDTEMDLLRSAKSSYDRRSS